MLNEKDITKICEDICEKVGYTFNIPVKINKRLTRTLGRVKWIKSRGVVNPYLMEISYQLLSTSTQESIMDVILHECAHYLVIVETHEPHGHDFYFKEMCKRIGCTNDGTHIKNLATIVPENEIYKYFVVCKDCGAVVGRYHRAGKIIKNIEDFYCKKCNGDLEVIQNY